MIKTDEQLAQRVAELKAIMTPAFPNNNENEILKLLTDIVDSKSNIASSTALFKEYSSAIVQAGTDAPTTVFVFTPELQNAGFNITHSRINTGLYSVSVSAPTDIPFNNEKLQITFGDGRVRHIATDVELVGDVFRVIAQYETLNDAGTRVANVLQSNPLTIIVRLYN